MPTSLDTRRQLLPRILLGASCAATGGGLLLFFLTGIPLWAGLGAVAGLAVGAWVVLWPRLAVPSRILILRRCRIGLIAGVPSIIAYDVSRYVLVRATGSSVKPFGAWPMFGELLGAGPHTGVPAFVVGAGYHVLNGLGFAMAFAVVLGERGVLAGIIWAMVLETAMVTFYPGWLGLAALQEFVSITILGHVAYGTVLGWLSRRLSRQDPQAVPQWTA
ncbi:DUF6789 family protein [Actinoplanes sp. NPDC049599]|uniref:DUF6789 family protein n=1 Tax=Actinoplanes sp. NPDC049599 TaxID=3363903 RepID=UPI003793F53E